MWVLLRPQAGTTPCKRGQDSISDAACGTGPLLTGVLHTQITVSNLVPGMVYFYKVGDPTKIAAGGISAVYSFKVRTLLYRAPQGK